MNQTTLKLQDAIRYARSARKQFDGAIEFYKAGFEKTELPKLSETVRQLSVAKSARTLVCPEEYRQVWWDFLYDKIDKLPSRAIRYLCWETDVAVDERFLQYLADSGESVTARSLQGLVYSQHVRWSEKKLINDLKTLREFINNYQGKNRLISKWRESLSIVLEPNSTQICCQEIVNEQIQPKDFFQKFGINEQTLFVERTMVNLVTALLANFVQDSNARFMFFDNVLTWKGFTLGSLKEVIDQALSHKLFFEDLNYQEQLANFVLQEVRFGDPRLPKNSTNWAGISSDAKSRLIQFLAREDIVFFFEQVMVGYDDRHGRKDFWLQYVNLLKQSRPLLNKKDKLRLKFQLNREKRILHFGETSGQQSAFILDFGSVLAVEFNGVGSIYLYDERNSKQLFPQIYEATFSDAKLKQSAYAIAKISHQGGWEYKVRHKLATLGIRPS